jgi:hypothetical protein
MPLVQLIIYLIIIGVLLWLVNTQIPMPQWIKTVINVLAVVFVALWLLSLFGIGGGYYVGRPH